MERINGTTASNMFNETETQWKETRGGYERQRNMLNKALHWLQAKKHLSKLH